MFSESFGKEMREKWKTQPRRMTSENKNKRYTGISLAGRERRYACQTNQKSNKWNVLK
jgi:hypothetical protein